MRLTIRSAITAASTGLLISGCGGAAGPPSGSPSASPATSSPVITTPASPPPVPTPATSPPVSPMPFAYQPLFPFGNLADAQAWQESYSSGGHQPWHLSADLTALAFTQGYLGFQQISKIAAHRIGLADAHVTVGLALPNGKISNAAVVHLVKLGSGRYAPWEVVGTDDTTLTLDIPAYGGIVSSPVTAGGKITGVDENLRVEVHELGTAGVVGSYCCQPAGGQASPWSVTVPFHAASGQVLTIVVHTGGHIASVERFAVTGVRVH